MPAPLARAVWLTVATGLIISLSILVAAGLAAYENPQIRAWFDESRRRIAVALHSLGDEIQPQREDASMREDASPEAESHRRRVRAEILQRAQVLRERQAQLDALESEMRGTDRTPRRRNTTSFDDFVGLDGKLKREEEEQAVSLAHAVDAGSAAQRAPGESSIRKRKATADVKVDAHESAATGASLLDATENVSPALQPPMPLSPRADSNARRTLSASSSQSSRHAVQLTPVTSRAPSTLHHGTRSETPSTPTRETPEEPGSTAQSPRALRSPPPPTDFRSVHEWAETSTASFYSPLQSVRGASPPVELGEGLASSVASVVGSSEAMSEAELVSEVGSALRTPDTWTEIGSVMSEEHM